MHYHFSITMNINVNDIQNGGEWYSVHQYERNTGWKYLFILNNLYVYSAGRSNLHFKEIQKVCSSVNLSMNCTKMYDKTCKKESEFNQRLL